MWRPRLKFPALLSSLYQVIECIQSNINLNIAPLPSPPLPSHLRLNFSLEALRVYIFVSPAWPLYLLNFVLFHQYIRERRKIIPAACHRFVQIVVEVTSTLIKLVAMQFVWDVGPCSKTTLSSPRFSFKRIVSEVPVPLDSSSQPKVGSLFFEKFYSDPEKKLSLYN